MLGKIVVGIKGVCPLLMNQLTPENYEASKKGKGKKGSKQDTSSPEHKQKEFEQAQYRTEAGQLCQPAEHLEKCLEIAGGSFKFEGQKKYGKVLCGGIIIDPEQIVHKIQTVVPMEKFVRIPPRTGAKVLKTRAKLPEWELEFVITVINESINFDVLKDIVTYAGTYVGIGDWRPKYGRFEVVKFEKAA